ncbi:MAG: AAA family ATPase [Oscillospiraceae bacterium]|nr:AAA family ATPase [Oscillospiraceae bacterium]
MRIYSMTATFGKLENQTLPLEPGLNVFHAPNEWGKSTWCAFLAAMLYGIDTRVHSTRTVLADKERYAPWSGSPMSGRIDLCWQGRNITIERTTKGRIPLGRFRAYETDSGLEVTEPTADNCGELLLGVEKSVFLRAGFLRLSDLPVTADEALRRRLNALVTTGDESTTADTLAQTLKDLKNRCRANRANGLLPLAEQEKADLEAKLRQIENLHQEQARCTAQQQEMEAFRSQLENHRQAMEYAASQTYTQKLSQAEYTQAEASKKLQLLQAQCASLPDADTCQKNLDALRTLHNDRDGLLRQSLPTLPEAPVIPAPYQGLTAEDAIRQARTDTQVFRESTLEKGRKLPTILGLALAVAGIFMCFIPHWFGLTAGIIAAIAGVLCWRINMAQRKRARNTYDALIRKYAPLPPDQWESAAAGHAQARQAYETSLRTYMAAKADHDARMTAWQQEIDALTAGQDPAQAERAWLDTLTAHRALREAETAYQQACQLVQALKSTHKEAPQPAMPDSLTYSPEQTARLLAQCEFSLRQLHNQAGQHQGQMAALGEEAPLRQALDAVNGRIARLEDTLAALSLAQDTLTAAAAELQRRFAPRISKQAQALFSKFTGGRYDRLILDEDLTLHAGAADETTLHSALWRSEGTADQLYLALRLAVARELTPESPLILDDVFARFDDMRLKAAMEILQEEAQNRQVILFTCHSREVAFSEN